MIFILLLSLLSMTYAAFDSYTMEVIVVHAVKFRKYDDSYLIKNFCELIFWKGTNVFPSAITIDDIATFCPFYFNIYRYKVKDMTDENLFRKQLEKMNLLPQIQH